MSHRLIIAMAGFARSGKDTAGAHLVEAHGFAQDAFGDDVRRAALAIDPIVPVGTGAYMRLGNLVKSVGWDRAKEDNPEVRRLLQHIATEGGRHLHGDDLWVSTLARRELALEPGRGLVVTDARFASEEAWLRERGAVVVRVERPGVGPLAGALGQHSSETYRIPHDHLVVNDGTVEELHAKIEGVLRLVLDQSPAERAWLRERS